MQSVGQWFAANGGELLVLQERESENAYWDKCFNFVMEQWDKPVSGLSEKQFNWLEKIVKDLENYENK